ncbi:hypothetical protein [uncultured Haemophilus sp.]|uniref:hypothetical protein n=1 Tax=uncultured Haemophilus sp. TaxID=237779 RepID=UPI0028041948|nr:hypothetical protein [uncultured Haemophilus sp.]
MKKLLFATLLFGYSNIAMSQCYGSDSYSNCYDNNGNSYSVSRYGNTTYQNGYDSNGNSWNQTITNYGNSTNYSGTDAQGNYFNKTCTTNFDGSRSCY